jgi:hypothetical protein
MCRLSAHHQLLIGFGALALHVLHGQLADELLRSSSDSPESYPTAFLRLMGPGLIGEQPWSMLLERLTPSAYH